MFKVYTSFSNGFMDCREWSSTNVKSLNNVDYKKSRFLVFAPSNWDKYDENLNSIFKKLSEAKVPHFSAVDGFNQLHFAIPLIKVEDSKTGKKVTYTYSNGSWVEWSKVKKQYKIPRCSISKFSDSMCYSDAKDYKHAVCNLEF